MGCTNSKGAPPPANYEATLAAYRSQIEEMNNKLKEQETMQHEEANLLRFKIELLANMLSTEEHRNQIASERIETLKWAVQEQTQKQGESGAVSASLISLQGGFQDNGGGLGIAGLGEAIAAMQTEFTQNKEGILASLAEQDGHIVSSLPRLVFMKQIYSATEQITKNEVELIALRFEDGAGLVNIPEFLAFFSASPTFRTARAASLAVSLSVEGSLALNDQKHGDDEDDDETQLADAEGMSVIPTKGLDRSTRLLLLLWPKVRTALAQAMTVLLSEDDNKDQPQGAAESKGEAEAKGGGSGSHSHSRSEHNLVSRNILEAALNELCGPRSVIISLDDGDRPLTPQDSSLLAHRFELVDGQVSPAAFLSAIDRLHKLHGKNGDGQRRRGPALEMQRGLSLTPFHLAASDLQALRRSSVSQLQPLQQSSKLPLPPPSSSASNKAAMLIKDDKNGSVRSQKPAKPPRVSLTSTPKGSDNGQDDTATAAQALAPGKDYANDKEEEDHDEVAAKAPSLGHPLPLLPLTSAAAAEPKTAAAVSAPHDDKKEDKRGVDAAAAKPTDPVAPAAPPSSFAARLCGCLGTGNKPPPAASTNLIADPKGPPSDIPAAAAKGHKGDDDKGLGQAVADSKDHHVPSAAAAKDTATADVKSSLPDLKPAGDGFDTPPKPILMNNSTRRTGGMAAGLPDRDGLGHGDDGNSATSFAPRTRLRRRTPQAGDDSGDKE